MNRRIKRKLDEAVMEYLPLGRILQYPPPPVSSPLEDWGGIFAHPCNVRQFELRVKEPDEQLMFFHAEGIYGDGCPNVTVYAIGDHNGIIGSHTWIGNDRFLVRDLFHTVNPEDVRYLILVENTQTSVGWIFPRRQSAVVCTIYRSIFPNIFQSLSEVKPVDLFLNLPQFGQGESVQYEPLYDLIKPDVDRLCIDFTRWVAMHHGKCAKTSLNDGSQGEYAYGELKYWRAKPDFGLPEERGSLIVEVLYGKFPLPCEVQFRRADTLVFELVGIKGSLSTAQRVLDAVEKSPDDPRKQHLGCDDKP